MRQADTQARSTSATVLDPLIERCDASRQAADASLALPPGESERQMVIDQAFLDLETCVFSLHDWLQKQRDADDEDWLRAWDARWSGEVGGVELFSAASLEEVTAWQDVRRQVFRLEQGRREFRDGELHRVLDTLADSAGSRWGLQSEVSTQQRVLSSEGLFTEMGHEVRALPEVLHHRVDHLSGLGGTWSGMLIDLLALRTGLWKAILLLLMLLVWRRWRLQARPLVHRLVGWSQDSAARRGLAMTWPKATERLVEAGTTTWTACIDALAWLALYGLLFYGNAVVTPWLVIVLLWIGWRVVPAGARLAIASPIERRPALLVGNRTVRERIVVTLRSILMWSLLYLLAATVVRQVLASYRLVEGVQLVARWALLVLVVFLLDRWAPLLRRQCRRLVESRWSLWLSRAPRGRLAGVLKAAFTVLFLLARLVLQGASRFLGGDGNFSWWRMRLARGDLQEHQKVRVALTEDEQQRIRQAEMQLVRGDVMERLQRNVAAWQRGQQRGLAALIGDQGCGKSSFLSRLAQQMEKAPEGEDALADGIQPLRVVRWQLDRHLVGRCDGLRWVWQQLQREDASSPEASAESSAEDLQELIHRRLESLPPSLFLVDDVHMAVRRAVGGFDAFKALKRCFYESSQRHFWVLAFHRPVWSFLQAVAVDVNLQVFRTRLQLEAWSDDELATWLSGCTRQAGFELDYSRLVRRGPFDDESKEEADRARQAYWQLLTNASSGNPEVAMLFWLDSLCHEDENSNLAVTLFEEPSMESVSGDTELFVLAALWMHGRLTIDGLTDVLNMPMGRVEMACRHLDSIGVLDEPGVLGFALSGRWRPPVERLLKQRHFIYAEG